MKWFRWLFIVLITLAGGLVGYARLTALRTERPVGFQITRATDPDGHPFAIGIWYPTPAQPWPTTVLGVVLMDVARNAPISGHDLPLVVISHGNGGGPASHADLALALANAGYIVAAPMHSGDNYYSRAQVSRQVRHRNRHRNLNRNRLRLRWRLRECRLSTDLRPGVLC